MDFWAILPHISVHWCLFEDSSLLGYVSYVKNRLLDPEDEGSIVL
jgi:hypothetical protein